MTRNNHTNQPPNPETLLSIAQIKTKPVGVYVSEDVKRFRPYTHSGFCLFSCFEDWMRGESTLVSKETINTQACPGTGYWLCGVRSVPREAIAEYLFKEEGLKASKELVMRWLESNVVREAGNKNVIIGPLRPECYDELQTITLYVTPDQLSLLITGAEYNNGNAAQSPVKCAFGSGCGMMYNAFEDLDVPQAVIGAVDIAMRPHIPENMLAFTMTKPLYASLCLLGEDSFLHKNYWRATLEARRNANLRR